MGQLNIPKFFTREAELLIQARKECINIHGSDIRAAGNEVEIASRKWLERMLPKNTTISHGHIIDMNNTISPQLDCIISDTKGISSLFRTRDGTDYSPMDSVYGIGEIKSTYIKSQKYIQNFSNVLQKIKTNMKRDLIENTLYNGLTDNTLIEHMLYSSSNRYLNKLYSFMLFIDSGDLKNEDIIEIYKNTNEEFLPNILVFLDKCIVIKATLTDDKMNYYKYPEEAEKNSNWFIIPMPAKEEISSEGKHLGILYHQLISHIKSSYLEIPNLDYYLKDLLIASKSNVLKI
ncbi:DUF6602 domain-containing protein [Aliarcobacter butzleri]|uniref:DUF6602 domain-containing protein n=1 Tax=Aliarcobacter butzleri TaxID=28197 RepID=UPI003AF9AF15